MTFKEPKSSLAYPGSTKMLCSSKKKASQIHHAGKTFLSLHHFLGKQSWLCPTSAVRCVCVLL